MKKEQLLRPAIFSAFLALVTVFVFFAPAIYVTVKQNTSLDFQLNTFQLAFGLTNDTRISGFSIPLLLIFVFTVVGLLLDLLGLVKTKLSFLSSLLYIAAGVLLFCVVPLSQVGFAYSPSSFAYRIEPGAIIEGCFLCVAGLVSFVNAILPKKVLA